MAGDPTMKQAGRAASAWQWTKNHTPYSNARAQFKKDNKAAEAVEDEKARLRAKDEYEQGKKPPAVSSPDMSTLEGGYTTVFKNRLIEAIRHSQRGNDEYAESDSIIREVVCHPSYLKAMRESSIPTPREPLDEVYKNNMQKRRKDLSEKLAYASQDPEYTLAVSDITALELDIIVMTMVGDSRFWDGNKWDGTGGPKPPEAFLMFLESVAVEENPANKAEFIANVLKDLTHKVSFGPTDQNPVERIVDVEYINKYVSDESTPFVKGAFSELKKLALAVLKTPTSEIQPSLEVPGTGYDRVYAETLAAKRNEAAMAEAQVAAATEAAEDAKSNKETWERNRETANVNGTVTCRIGGTTVTLSKDDPTLHIEVKNATDAAEAATKAKVAAEAQRAEANKNRDKHAKENSPEAIAAKLARNFRRYLTAAKDRYDEKSLIAALTAEPIENKAVMSLAKDADKLIKEREDAGGNFDALLIASEMARIEKRGRTSPAHSASIEEKKNAFIAKVDAFDAAIDKALLPESTKMAFKSITKDLRDLDFLAQLKPGSIREVKEANEIAKGLSTVQLSNIRKQLANVQERDGQPIRKIVEVCLENLKKRKSEDPLGITKEERVEIRRIYLAGSGKLEEGIAKSLGLLGRAINNFTRFMLEVLKEAALDAGKLVWLHVLPGKQLFGTYDWDNEKWNADGRLRPGNLTKRYSYKTKDKRTGHDRMEPVNWLPNWVVGSFWLGMKSYFIYTSVVYWAISATGNYYLEKKTDRSWIWPPKPWTYFAKAREDIDNRMYIDDSYHIVRKLADRPFEYYTKTYGVGNVLPGDKNYKANYRKLLGFFRVKPATMEGSKGKLYETACRSDWIACERNLERLYWLREHPDVLRFFQERATMKRYMHDVDKSEAMSVKNDNFCSKTVEVRIVLDGEAKNNTTYEIPPMCKDANGLNLGDWNVIATYTPVTTKPDGWKKEMGVCCTLDLDLTGISDGLKLNKLMGDRFVEELMRIESEGLKVKAIGPDGKVTEKIVDKDGKELKKTDEKKFELTYKFLTSPDAMAHWTEKDFLITDNDLRIMETGVSEKGHVVFLRTQGAARIDEFIKMCGEKGEAKWRINDANREQFVGLWMKKITDAMPGANLAIAYIPEERLTSTFNSALEDGKKNGWVENTMNDFRRREVKASMQYFNFSDTSLDFIALETILDPKDEVRQLLLKFKSKGEMYEVTKQRPDDFIRRLQEYKYIARMPVSDYDPFTTPPGQMVASAVGEGLLVQHAAPAAKEAKTMTLALTDEARAYFATHDALSSVFEGSLLALRNDGHADGKVARSALWRVFNGDEAGMADSLKQDAFMWVNSGRNLAETGISAEGKIDDKDVNTAGRALRMHMLGYLKNVMPQGPMPVPQPSNDAEAFYYANPDLAKVVDDIINKLHTTKVKNASLTRTVLKTVFGDDQARMDSALREWVYRELAACSDPATYQSRTGISVTKDGQGKVASAVIEGKGSVDKARTAVTQRIWDMLEWVQLPPEAVQQNPQAGQN